MEIFDKKKKRFQPFFSTFFIKTLDPDPDLDSLEILDPDLDSVKSVNPDFFFTTLPTNRHPLPHPPLAHDLPFPHRQPVLASVQLHIQNYYLYIIQFLFLKSCSQSVSADGAQIALRRSSKLVT
jgi:hypothetical protein